MNPLFIGGAFMGGAASLVAATVAHRQEPARLRLLAAASAVYALGVVDVTMAGNVPLNEKLAKVSQQEWPCSSALMKAHATHEVQLGVAAQAGEFPEHRGVDMRHSVVWHKVLVRRGPIQMRPTPPAGVVLRLYCCATALACLCCHRPYQ